MLWATILLIWELIGVDLSKAKDVGGTVGAIITLLKSPQAVPWVLLGFVGYFLFKCYVEWAQCQADRRRVPYARIDFLSALLVSVTAIALYAYQAITRSQLANNLHIGEALDKNKFSVISGTALGLAIGSFIAKLRHDKASKDYPGGYVMPAVFLLAGGTFALYGRHLWSWRFALVSAALSAYFLIVDHDPAEALTRQQLDELRDEPDLDSEEEPSAK